MGHGLKRLKLVFAACWESDGNWDREGSSLLLAGAAQLAHLSRFVYKKPAVADG